MAGRLEGKVAVITGAASGIGRATAELFVAEGARVIATDIDDEHGAELERAHGDRLRYRHADVTSETDIAAVVDAAAEEFGRLDIMFNNAGAPGDPAPVLELTAAGFDRTLAMLARSALLGTRFAAQRFRAQDSAGSIINTASSAGLQGGWSTAGYSIGKHAVIGVTRQSAAELGPHGIRVNAIAPGIIRTPIMARSFGVPLERADEFAEFLNERHGPLQPIGRLGLPSDIAEAALWLGSDASTFVTGIVLPVDGGATSIYAGAGGGDVLDLVHAFLSPSEG
ncbi:glucose 1-dehydrogenase [Microbacterium trichothecenolyticum]|uniref:SDR family NAD(P)-dependent oxidoreductase n=1 Tax=Microbacterium trichothecenolyticum TaxID=69370 RepID=UPI001C6F2FB8|nr:glucose 1-dehydrogenase [Microbacterium trichothecenolyticum]MBW9120494.1 glucose 1-dehydrogenase [Microbacterium trichothecenolyticum]